MIFTIINRQDNMPKDIEDNFALLSFVNIKPYISKWYCVDYENDFFTNNIHFTFMTRRSGLVEEFKLTVPLKDVIITNIN